MAICQSGYDLFIATSPGFLCLPPPARRHRGRGCNANAPSSGNPIIRVSAVTGQKLVRSKQSLHTPSSPLKTANIYNGLLVQVISARQGLVDRCCCRLPLHDDWPNGRQVMVCSSLARSLIVRHGHDRLVPRITDDVQPPLPASSSGIQIQNELLVFLFVTATPNTMGKIKHDFFDRP